MRNTDTYASVKVVIGAHIRWNYVARQIDGTSGQITRKIFNKGWLHVFNKEIRPPVLLKIFTITSPNCNLFLTLFRT